MCNLTIGNNFIVLFWQNYLIDPLSYFFFKFVPYEIVLITKSLTFPTFNSVGIFVSFNQTALKICISGRLFITLVTADLIHYQIPIPLHERTVCHVGRHC